MRKWHTPWSIWDAVFDRQGKCSITTQFELHTNRIFFVSKHLGPDGCNFIIPVELMSKQWSKETDALQVNILTRPLESTAEPAVYLLLL